MKLDDLFQYYVAFILAQLPIPHIDLYVAQLLNLFALGLEKAISESIS